MADFASAFTALIGNEGGYANDPRDPGGETMWGVTARVARARGYTGAMRDLPLDTARGIARAEYWDPYHCDELPEALGFQVLDAAYNGGYPAKWLQLAVGEKPDGKVGAETVAAANSANVYQVQLRFLAQRLAYMTCCGAWKNDGRGWSARIARNMMKGAV